MEIDEYQNYEKALGALTEAARCLGKVSNWVLGKGMGKVRADHTILCQSQNGEVLSVMTMGSHKSLTGTVLFGFHSM